MHITRRAILAAGVAAGSAAYKGLAAETQPSQEGFPTLDGELRFDEVSRATAADDFGHLVHRPPAGVLLPGSVEDVARTIEWASRRHQPALYGA